MVMSRIVFFGNERLVSGLATTSAPVLTNLIHAGYDIAAVVSHHSDGKSRSNRQLEVAQIAQAHNIPVLLPIKPADIHDELVALNAEAAVLVAYGRIIPQGIIDIFPKGIINIHPSLLPSYRGPTPIESAILHGDSETGVSIMLLSAAMDAGPVFAQETRALSGQETKFDVYTLLADISAQLLINILPSILDGSLEPHEQDHSKATYCTLLTKQDAWLDTNNFTATQLERHVRACLTYPKSKIKVRGHEIVVTKARVSHEQLSELDIACLGDEYFSIDELIAPSGKKMNSDAFLRGYAG